MWLTLGHGAIKADATGLHHLRVAARAHARLCLADRADARGTLVDGAFIVLWRPARKLTAGFGDRSRVSARELHGSAVSILVGQYRLHRSRDARCLFAVAGL